MKLSGRLQKQHLMHRGVPIIAHPASASFRHRLDRGLYGGLATAGWRQVPTFKRGCAQLLRGLPATLHRRWANSPVQQNSFRPARAADRLCLAYNQGHVLDGIRASSNPNNHQAPSGFVSGVSLPDPLKVKIDDPPTADRLRFGLWFCSAVGRSISRTAQGNGGLPA